MGLYPEDKDEYTNPLAIAEKCSGSRNLPQKSNSGALWCLLLESWSRLYDTDSNVVQSTNHMMLYGNDF
jgi:hypothetical protein